VAVGLHGAQPAEAGGRVWRAAVNDRPTGGPRASERPALCWRDTRATAGDTRRARGCHRRRPLAAPPRSRTPPAPARLVADH
jgi:hypothetical protein